MMARFSLFRDLADFFSYKRRRIINWAVIALSVIPGTIYWLLPATLWRNWFIFEYLSVIGLGIVSQRRFLYRFTAMTAFALFSWRRYRPTRYSSPEMDGLAKQMRTLGKVQVFTTDNPFVEGPFTFCFASTCRIYTPTT